MAALVFAGFHVVGGNQIRAVAVEGVVQAVDAGVLQADAGHDAETVKVERFACGNAEKVLVAMV